MAFTQTHAHTLKRRILPVASPMAVFSLIINILKYHIVTFFDDNLIIFLFDNLIMCGRVWISFVK